MLRVLGGRSRQCVPACIDLEMDDDGISPRFDQSALITIDTQIDTLDGQPLEIPGTTAALPAIATLTQSFRESGRPIIHVVRLYLADGSNAEPSRSSRVSGDTPILRPGHAGDSSPPRSSAMFQPNLMRTFFCPGHPVPRTQRGSRLQAEMGGLLSDTPRRASRAQRRQHAGLLWLQLPELPPNIDL